MSARRKAVENATFERRIGKMLGPLRRRCRAIAGSAWDGDDLFQTTLIKTYDAWMKNPGRPLTAAYLFRIAINAWIDRKRRKSIDEQACPDIENKAGTPDTFDEAALMRGMNRLIMSLTPKQRLVVMMIDGWGMTAAQAAMLIGEREGNVRVIRHRAGKRLRRAVDVRTDAAADELTARYLEAFRSGDPDRLLRLDREERQRTAGPFACLASRLAA
jgi:RNA polymerase sigma-70 factor (ECF subfamily)